MFLRNILTSITTAIFKSINGEWVKMWKEVVA